MSALPDRYPTDLAFHPNNDSIIYVTYSGFGSGHVFVTEDFGQSRMDITGSLPDIPTNAIAVNPDYPQVLYVGNDLGVYMSEDYGSTWNSFQMGLPEAVIAMDLVVSRPNRKLRLATHGNGAYQRNMPLPTNIGAEEPIAPQAQIYPNPFADRLNIEVPRGTKVAVIDMQGRVVYRGVPGTLETSAWPSGAYVVHWEGQSRRVVKQ